MRILIIANALDNQNTGIHHYVKGMVNVLASGSRRHQYILVREKADPRLAMPQIVLWNPRLPIVGTLWHLFVVLPILIPRLARQRQADAVLEPAHLGPFNLPRSIKQVNIVHDLTAIKFPAMHRWHSQALQNWTLRSILRRADLIVTNSNHTSRDVVAFDSALEPKTHCIYPAANTAVDSASAESQRFQALGDYMLFIGTIEPRKNLVRLLRAYEMFRDMPGTRLKLVIAGAMGWKSREFRQALAANRYRSDILLTGYVSNSEKQQLLRNCLFFIYPSLYEGFGLPVLEAISSGKSSIVSGVSSLPEVAGNCALYVNPKDEDDIARQIARLSSDDSVRKSLEANCPAQAGKFSWDRFATEFEEAVSRL